MRLVKGLLERSLQVIELLAEDSQWRLSSDIAEQLELQEAPTKRLLVEMSMLGWIEKDAKADRYRLTLKLALLGQQFLQDTGLLGIVQPVLDDVAKRCGELVRLTVVQDNRLQWLASAQGAPPGLMYRPLLNGRPLLHATANGKAWLATLTNETAIRLAIDSGLGIRPIKGSSVGPRVVQSVEELLQQLDITRSHGYSLAVEEGEPGVKAIALAVREPNRDQVLGTISIAGPLIRMGVERDSEFYDLLHNASRTLGLVWPLNPSTKTPETSSSATSFSFNGF